MPRRVCLDCGVIATSSRCMACAAKRERQRDARRGGTTARGLGAEHQRQLRQLKRAAGPLDHCPRCGREITMANPISGEHSTARAHGGQIADSLICRSCNSSMGARIRRS